MILSYSKKFIFFCNGKTGSTSMRKCLWRFQEGEEYNLAEEGVFVAKHIPPQILRAHISPEIWQECFKFVFVRNPWDRFVSAWKHNFRFRRKISMLDYLCHPKNFRRHIKNIKNIKNMNALSMRDHFDVEDVDFLFNHLKRYRGLSGSDGFYQCNYVFSEDGTQLVDFIGRFERIVEDFDYVKKRLGLEVELPFVNKTKHLPYRQCFTDKAKDRVAELWKKDIEAFGYEF